MASLLRALSAALILITVETSSRDASLFRGADSARELERKNDGGIDVIYRFRDRFIVVSRNNAERIIEYPLKRGGRTV